MVLAERGDMNSRTYEAPVVAAIIAIATIGCSSEQRDGAVPGASTGEAQAGAFAPSEEISLVSSAEAVDTSGWGMRTSTCGYTYLAPPQLTEEPLRGTDSCISRLRNEDCTYKSDYGGFSSNLDEFSREDGFREEITQIGGMAARFVRVSPRASGAHLIAVRMPLNEPLRTGLAIMAECASAQSLASAGALFLTIQFPQ
jgi:hypothetical protein